MDWHYLGELKSSVVRLTPLLRVITWLNARTMDNYLSEALDDHYADRCAVAMCPESNNSVIDLLLSDYMSKHKDKLPATLDTAFKKWAIPQLRILFFVGHDSSAATICYVFYLLNQNPSAMQKLRAEHDELFGTERSAASNLLRTQPQLLNKLPYTTAVIKEVLRLFPPASGFRYGRPGVGMVGTDSARYPTDDTRVWILHSVLHRNERYWKDPSSFIPERFLVGPEDPLYPVKGAYRPFEHGPRDACIWGVGSDAWDSAEEEL
jgi:cytochrome P450